VTGDADARVVGANSRGAFGAPTLWSAAAHRHQLHKLSPPFLRRYHRALRPAHSQSVVHRQSLILGLSWWTSAGCVRHPHRRHCGDRATATSPSPPLSPVPSGVRAVATADFKGELDGSRVAARDSCCDNLSRCGDDERSNTAPLAADHADDFSRPAQQRGTCTTHQHAVPTGREAANTFLL
jgi:hypothetical protein